MNNHNLFAVQNFHQSITKFLEDNQGLLKVSMEMDAGEEEVCNKDNCEARSAIMGNGFSSNRIACFKKIQRKPSFIYFCGLSVCEC